MPILFDSIDSLKGSNYYLNLNRFIWKNGQKVQRQPTEQKQITQLIQPASKEQQNSKEHKEIKLTTT